MSMKWHFEKLDRANSVGEIYHLYRRVSSVARGVNWYGRKLVSRETSFYNYEFFSFPFFLVPEIKTQKNREEHSPPLKSKNIIIFLQ